MILSLKMIFTKNLKTIYLPIEIDLKIIYFFYLKDMKISLKDFNTVSNDI